MKSISIPFRISNEGIAETTDIDTITKQKIVDVLMTMPGERAIEVGYGAGLKSLLYEPIDSLVFEDFKVDALDAINESLDSGRVVDITITYPDSPQMAYPEDSTIMVSVKYVIPPYGGRSFSFNVTSDI